MPKNKLENRIFNALNTEFKSFLLGFAISNQYRSSWTIMKKAQNIADPALLPTDERAFQRVFMPTTWNASIDSFLDVDRDDKRGSNVFRFNSAGKRYNIKDIARFMMYSAIKFDLSAWEWLGISQNDGPMRSVTILEELNDKGTLQRVDLENIFGTSAGSIKERLQKLHNHDLINMDSYTSEKEGWIIYVANGKDIDTKNDFKYPMVARKIKTYLAKNKAPFTHIDFMDSSGYKDPRKVQITLRAFERKGYIKSIVPWVGGNRYSVINLTERGRRLFNDTLQPILTYARDKDKDALAYIRRKRIYDENIDRALKLYQDIRPNSISLPVEQRLDQITSFLSEGEKRYKEIEQHLGVKATKYLTTLLKEGKVKKVSRGIYALR